MPVFKAKLSFQDPDLLGNNDYSFNVHVSASNSSTAWAVAEGVASAMLSTVIPTTVKLTSIGVSNPDVVNGTLIIPQDSAGGRATTGDKLPGWNVVNMRLAAANGERIHNFYLRVGLTENDVAGQVVGATLLGQVVDLIDGIVALDAVCTKDGQVFTVGSVSPNVHMRQMGWSRRHRVGYKRGWVPA